MVRPAEQSRPDTLRHRLTGSWLLRKWTPSQPSPTTQGEGQPLIAYDRSVLDSDALRSPAGRQGEGIRLLLPGGQDFYAGGCGAGCVGGVSGEIGLDDVVPRGEGPHGESCHASVVHLTHTQDRVTFLEGHGSSPRLLSSSGR